MIMSSIPTMHAICPGFLLENIPLVQIPTILRHQLLHHNPSLNFVVVDRCGERYRVLIELNMHQQAVDIFQICIHLWEDYIGLNHIADEEISTWFLERLPALETICGHGIDEANIENDEEEEQVRQMLMVWCKLISHVLVTN